MAIYPQSIKTEYYNGTSWVDISSYVVSDISGFQGFSTGLPDDRVATLGMLELELNNVNKLFTPYGGDSVRGLSTLTGFNKGAKVRVSIVINNIPYVYWTGRIDSINSDDGTWGNRRVQIVAVDWMDVASKYPMKLATLLTNKKINEAVQTIVNRILVKPESTDFDIGNETFPTVFSNVRGRTRAISELNKLTMSELGYIYLKKNGTLKVENKLARVGTRNLDIVPIHPDLLTNLLLTDGDSFLLIDGDTLLLNDTETANIEFTPEKLDIELNNDILNTAYIRAYPTRTATSLEVVFNLGSPIAIAGGATITFTGNYTNPNGGNPISATNLQSPVATTDYLANTASDGSGTNATGSLSVWAIYYGDLVEYTLTNSYSQPIYVTKLQARGYGIYFDNPIEATIEDTTSITAYGDTTAELDQKYKSNLYAGEVYGKTVVELNKYPKSRIKKATFTANTSHQLMMACVHLDVGSLVEIYDNRSEMSKWYYIFSRKFLITLGGILTVVFGLIEAPSVASGGLNPVAVELSATGDGINFGYLPHVYSDSTPETVSISLWIKPPSIRAGWLATLSATESGLWFSINNSVAYPGKHRLAVFNSVFNDAGGWYADNLTISANTWHLVTLVYDMSLAANDPLVYLDGVSQTITEYDTPSGTSKFSRNGSSLIIGNANTANWPIGTNSVLYGQYYDVRFYQRLLSASEVTALYNSGTPSMTVGPQDMVFQGLAIDSDLGDATSLNGQQIPTGHSYFDNVLLTLGTSYGSPKIR